MFAALPPKPDHDALELRDPRALGARGHLRPAAGQERRRPAVQLHRRARSRRTSRSPCTPPGAARSRTCSSATRRCRASTSATRTASTARASGSRSASRRSSGLNSKREIEEYGLEEFARRCRAVVERSSAELTEGSIRLGQWMDWGKRLLHVLRHEHRVHLAVPADRPRAGLAVPGPPRHGVVPALRHVDLGPRAGRQLRRPRGPGAVGALPAARPARARPSSSGPPRRGRCRPTWPSPCSRPPRYGRLANGDWVAVERAGDQEVVETLPGQRAGRAGATRVRSTTSGPAATVAHRVIAWDEVSLDEGTGLVHIAPGCGTEDFELEQGRGPARAHARRRVGPLLRRLRLAGRPRRPRVGRRHHRRPPRRATCWSRPARSPTATPSAGAATRR